MENTALKVELMQDPWSSLNMVLLSTILIRYPLIIGYVVKPALVGTGIKSQKQTMQCV